MEKPAVFICAADNADAFALEVDQILDVLGVRRALVTDRSQLSDFFTFVGDAEHDQKEEARESVVLRELTERAGRPVQARDYVWEVARDLRARQSVH